MKRHEIEKYVDCDRCKWLDEKQPLYCSKFKKNLIESEYWNDEYCVMFEDKSLDTTINDKENKTT